MKNAPATLEPASAPSVPRWEAVDFMIDFNTREKRFGLLTETLSWAASVAFFRRAETETHYLAKPTKSDQRYHKTLLAALIAGGERLLSRIHRAGSLPDNLDGIKAADVDAMVEELRNTHSQWYGSMTGERRAEILKNVLHVPPA